MRTASWSMNLGMPPSPGQGAANSTDTGRCAIDCRRAGEHAEKGNASRAIRTISGVFRRRSAPIGFWSSTFEVSALPWLQRYNQADDRQLLSAVKKVPGSHLQCRACPSRQPTSLRVKFRAGSLGDGLPTPLSRPARGRATAPTLGVRSPLHDVNSYDRNAQQDQNDAQQGQCFIRVHDRLLVGRRSTRAASVVPRV